MWTFKKHFWGCEDVRQSSMMEFKDVLEEQILVVSEMNVRDFQSQNANRALQLGFPTIIEKYYTCTMEVKRS